MLRYMGCNAGTDLLSTVFGDEIALRKDLVGLDMGNRAELGRVFVQAFKRLYYDLEPAAQQQAIAGPCRDRKGPGGHAKMVPGQHHVRMNMYIAQAQGGRFIGRLGDVDALGAN